MRGITKKAYEFAKQAHKSAYQLRKYTGEPYIVHPLAVYELVNSVEHDENMLAAALLHDVVEDTSVTLEDIVYYFGWDIEWLVFWLTDVSEMEDGNREARKRIDRNHIANAPAAAQTIKVADLIDNTKTIVKHDPNFARVYTREKELLLDVLTRADSTLMDMAKKQLEEYTGIIH